MHRSAGPRLRSPCPRRYPAGRRKPAPGVRHGTPRMPAGVTGRAAAGHGPATGADRHEEAPHDAARGPDRPRHLPGGRGHPRGRPGRLPHHGAAEDPEFAPLPGERPGASADFGTTSLEQAEGESLDGRLAREVPGRRIRGAAPRRTRSAPTPSWSRTWTRRRRRTRAPSAPPTTSRPPPTRRSAARDPRRAPSTSPTADRGAVAPSRVTADRGPERPPGVGWHGARTVVYVCDRGSAGSRAGSGARPGPDTRSTTCGTGDVQFPDRTAVDCPGGPPSGYRREEHCP